jgi:hypothetical protein
MNALLQSIKDHNKALMGLRKAMQQLARSDKYTFVYYPTEDSVHVRRIRQISVFDEDAYFLYALRNGKWELEVDTKEAPF